MSHTRAASPDRTPGISHQEVEAMLRVGLSGLAETANNALREAQNARLETADLRRDLETAQQTIARQDEELAALRGIVDGLPDDIADLRRYTDEQLQEHQERVDAQFEGITKRVDEFDHLIQQQTQDIALKSSQESFQALETRQEEAARATTVEVTRCTDQLTQFIACYNNLTGNYLNFRSLFLWNSRILHNFIANQTRDPDSRQARVLLDAEIASHVESLPQFFHTTNMRNARENFIALAGTDFSMTT